jgi:hypothetical protein
VQQSLTDPSQGVWSWDQEPVGADTESRTGLGILESHRSKYVVDIDVEAFKHQLPYFIRDYQDLELFLALADNLGLGDGRAIRKEGDRYLATVNGVAYGLQKEYDITDTIEQIRARTIREGDARMQAELRGLSDAQIGQIYRLKSGPNTTLYRSAGESAFRGDQVLVDSQRFMGPDPWVRTLGRYWFWNQRVLVAPANGDALRAAQLATYWVGRQDIEETLEEVKDGNRPILSESRIDDRLEGFVAGPDPEGRFGRTRYVRDPKNPRNWTIAVGELKQFWVDVDELEQVHAVQALNYAALPAEAAP